MKREMKKQQKARYQSEKEGRRIDCFQEVFSALGVGDWFRRLRIGQKVTMSKVIMPPPKVVLDSSVNGDATAQKIAAFIANCLAAPDEELQLTPAAWFSVAPVLMSAFDRLDSDSMTAKDAEACANAFMGARKKITSVFDHMFLMVTVYLKATVCLCSDLEKGPYWCELSPQLPMVITLGRVNTESMHVTLDGIPRLAYRGAFPSIDGRSVNWMTWPNNQGKEGTGLPIYIQGHAIHRLHERVNLGLWDTVGVIQSLLKPNVIREEGGDIWIEYAIREHRLGYLIARKMADKVVVRTFLFLTMNPTPESVLLREKLRIRRPDIEYNRLDRLETFIGTDIRDDQELCQLLTECNCGHLTKVPNELPSDMLKTGVASELKQYLGIDTPASRPRLS